MTDHAKNGASRTKHCILMVVDALSETVVRERIASGALPNVAKLASGGGRLQQCLSIFPSITPAATCSIVTGCYPAQHCIEGACWYDRENQEIAFYGDDLQLTLERGFRNYLVDFADRLNFERLQRPTLFDLVEAAGVESACVNFMWFAGPHPHQRTTPMFLRWVAGKLSPEVRGPKYLKLGDFVEALPVGVQPLSKQGIFKRYGFKDQVTAECMMAMAESGTLPPMTLAYFPDNDYKSHEDGPETAADSVLTRFDRFLGEFVDMLGGWQRLGDDVEILVVGDHSQVEFDDCPNVCSIDQCLAEFQQAQAGHGWRPGDQLFVCPNMRAASIFLRDHRDETLQAQVVAKLLAEPSIDQVIYEVDNHIRRVVTADRGSLEFARAAADQPADVTDSFGNRWSIRGELDCVGGGIDQHGRLTESVYPNPLERIDGGFVPNAYPIWVTARPNTEFCIRETSSHDGGSHGSLHVEDTEAALITTAGVPIDKLVNPQRPRIIDVVSLCCAVLGIKAPTPASSTGQLGWGGNESESPEADATLIR